MVTLRFTLYPRRLQPVAQHHQLVNLSNDSVLLGEGREGNKHLSQNFKINV